MSHTDDKAKGKLDEIGGNIKQGIGKLIGNEQMQAEGKAQELKGEAQQEAARNADYAEGVADEAKGNLKQGLGGLIGNEQMQAEGKADELKGETKQRLND